MDPVILPCDPRSPAAWQLLTAMAEEIAALYGEEDYAPAVPRGVDGPGGCFLVAWLGDRPVGCGALRPFDEPGVGEIKRMFVEREMRGQHIGEQVVRALEELARSCGYDTLRLETGVYQPAAIRLYERCGFNRIPCYGHYAAEPLSICFEKKLKYGG